MQVKKLIVAETGQAPGNLPAQFGGYGQMMTTMLAPLMPDTVFQTDRVFGGDPLSPPQPGAGLLITGSPAGVYDDDLWITALEQSVRDYIAAGCPVVGICFGHQLMTQALGGVVEKSPKGWGVGVHTYDAVGAEWPWSEGPRRFSCAVSHQDQVISLPDGARRIAGSAFCPNGVISYAEGRALSFQMHPEFEPDFGLALLNARTDRIAEDAAQLARASYDVSSDRGSLARWIAQFLQESP